MRLLLTITLVGLAFATTAQADSIDFEQFSGRLGNPVAGLTDDGVAFTITGPGPAFTVLTQGVNWSGTFPTGATVLLNGRERGNVTFEFGAALTRLSDLGVQANGFGAYTATLVASLGGAQVGTFSLTGVSEFAPGTVPAFDFEIATGFNSFVLSSTNDNAGFGLGNAAVGGTAVPEPTTWAMLIVGISVVGHMLRRTRRLLWRAAVI